MKCDELEAEQWLDYSGEPNVCYPADKVNEAIAELKAKLHDAEMAKDLAEAAETERKIDYDKLKAENERLKKEVWEADERAIDAGATSVEKMEELRATRSALCLLRAECARRKWCELYYEKKRDLRALKNENTYITKQMEKYESIKQYWKAKAEEYK